MLILRSDLVILKTGFENPQAQHLVLATELEDHKLLMAQSIETARTETHTLQKQAVAAIAMLNVQQTQTRHMAEHKTNKGLLNLNTIEPGTYSGADKDKIRPWAK